MKNDVQGVEFVVLCLSSCMQQLLPSLSNHFPTVLVSNPHCAERALRALLRWCCWNVAGRRQGLSLKEYGPTRLEVLIGSLERMSELGTTPDTMKHGLPVTDTEL